MIVNGNNYIVGGDVIISVDGESVAKAQDLVDLVASKRPGDQITLEVIRGDHQSTVTLTIDLGRRPPAGG